MINENYFFKLFANCILSVGDDDIYLIDYHMVSYLKIDDYIYDLVVNKSNKLNISDIKNDSELGDDAVEILNFLVENNFGFFVDDITQYPDIDSTFDSPEIINNAIVEIENIENYNIDSLISQLNDLFCGKLEIWVTKQLSLKKLIAIIAKFEDSFIRTIQIIINYNFLSAQDIIFLDNIDYLKKLDKLELIIYNYTNNKASDNLHFTKDDLYHANYLSLNNNPIHINLDFYLESKKHNVFLNKKVCIDTKGNIKNFLSFNKSFGNINDDSLADVIQSNDFQKLWFVNNDKIEQIRHSPFKYCFPILEEPILDNKSSLYNITSLDSYPWDTEANSR